MSQQVEQILSVNRHLRAAIDQILDGVLIIDADFDHPDGPEVIFVNQAFCTLCGKVREELVGRPLGEVFPTEHLKAIGAFLETVDSQTGCPFPAPLQTALCGGAPISLDGSAATGLDALGEPLSYTLTMRPATEADSPQISLSPTPETQRPVDLATGGITESTEEKDADEIMDLSRMESLALVASGIAHDFNNVLTTILANLSLAIPLVEEEEEKDLGSYIKQAAVASEGARDLTKKLLSFARGGKPKKEPCDLGKLLGEAIELSSYGSNVRCEVQIDRALYASQADPVQVLQIFNNLLINAWQAMPSGGVIQATAENSYLGMGEDPELPQGHYVIISIRDRGCGIPEEKLEQIFEPFFTTKKHGSGLGLATCATVIREHGGIIRVKSKLGAGTVFRLYLPSDGTLASAIKAPPSNPHHERGVVRGHGGSVLVVDDQRAVLDISCRILGMLGYDVHRASSGQDGVEMFRYLSRSETRVEAVLMDMTLPGGMNGREATAEILRIDPQARVVATSGFFDDETIGTLRMEGFVGILPKPFTIESLSQIMDDAIRAKVDPRMHLVA